MRKTLFLWAITLLIPYVFFEATSFVALAHLMKGQAIPDYTLNTSQEKHLHTVLDSEKPSRYVHHPHLGWTLSEYQTDTIVHNSQRHRSDHEYGTYPSDDTVRIAAIGDSFTYGIEVLYEEAWPTRMEHTHPHIEVMNYGVGGYGIDQMYLLYELEGEKFHPDIVLLGVIPNDLRRSFSILRGFFRGKGKGKVLSKPRFTLEGETLQYHPPPFTTDEEYEQLFHAPEEVLPSIVMQDPLIVQAIGYTPPGTLPSLRLLRYIQHTKIFEREDRRETKNFADRNSEMHTLNMAIFSKFRDLAASRKHPLVLVVFPTKHDVADAKEGEVTAAQILVQEMQDKNFVVIDVFTLLKEYFLQTPPKEIFGANHFSAETNRRVAEVIYSELQARGLLD